MNVKPKMTYSNSLSLYLILLLSLCAVDLVFAQEQEEETQSNLKNDRLPAKDNFTASLQSILTQLKATLKPDMRNGLVRVALLNIESSHPKEARIVLEALQQQIEALPNILATDPEEIDKYVLPLTQDPIPFDLPRKLSLSRLLGVRYAFSGKLSKEADGWQLELEVISLKKLGIIAKASIPLKGIWLKALITTHWVEQSQGGSIWRSALLPGWGQIHQEQYGKGILYMGTSITLFGLALYSQMQAQDHLNRYEQNLVTSVDDRADAKLYQAQANLLWFGLAGIWITNLIDSAICAENKIKIMPFANQKGANGLMLSTEF
jgi:hypothetical protein